MQRIQVISHLTMGKTEMEKVTVEARCSSCIFWEQCEGFPHDSKDEIIESDRGHCHRYPRDTNKQKNDWCGEFVPEKEKE